MILSTDQLLLLHDILLPYKECIAEKGNCLYHELNDESITSILTTNACLLCEDDLISLGLMNPQLLLDIVALIDEV